MTLNIDKFAETPRCVTWPELDMARPLSSPADNVPA